LKKPLTKDGKMVIEYTSGAEEQSL